MSAREPMINPYEVNELTKYCLRILTYTDELRGDTALKQAYEKAKELENSIRKLKIASLMENKTLICVAGMQGAGKTTLMSSARVPENPFSPNKAKNILLGFVVGFVLACAVVVLRTMLDDTYKSADDIRKYTGMVVLASIPLADAGEQPKEKSEFKRRTKRFANDVRRRGGGSSGRKA